MMFKQRSTIYAILAATAAHAESSSGQQKSSFLRGQRQLAEDAPCAELEGCYLWDKTAKVEIKLTGDDSYCPSDSTRGWSVRCDTNYPVTEDCDGNDVTAELDEIKFFYDGTVKDEYGEPRWMNGDSDPTKPGDNRWINDVAYLIGEGDKEFRVEGRQWSQTCFAKKFTLRDNCQVAMPRSVTDAPSASPTKTPTKSPTGVPTGSPTDASTVAPTTTSPTKSPTDAPSDAPTHAPTSTPTSPPPPEMTSCARAAYKMHYAPDVPVGWLIEGINPDGERKFLDVQGPSPRPLIRAEERWWHSFSTHYLPNHETKLRFVNEDGVAGPWHVCKKNSPIGIDINGSGAVERIEGSFTIDITGDGDIETLNEWFAPTEGILIDVTHGIEGGVITGHHLFGDMGGVYSDGFAKLALFDDDQDGVVSGDELEGFAVWTDANSNAMLDEGELSTLADHAIVSLNTSHTTYISTATLSDGSTMYIEDLWFAR